MCTHPRDRSAWRADAAPVAILKQGTDVWDTWRTDHYPDHTPEMPRLDTYVKRGLVVPLRLARRGWARGAQRVRDAASEVKA
jgi:hypothetical protein